MRYTCTHTHIHRLYTYTKHDVHMRMHTYTDMYFTVIMKQNIPGNVSNFKEFSEINVFIRQS